MTICLVFKIILSFSFVFWAIKKDDQRDIILLITLKNDYFIQIINIKSTNIIFYLTMFPLTKIIIYISIKKGKENNIPLGFYYY